MINKNNILATLLISISCLSVAPSAHAETQQDILKLHPISTGNYTQENDNTVITKDINIQPYKMEKTRVLSKSNDAAINSSWSVDYDQFIKPMYARATTRIDGSSNSYSALVWNQDGKLNLAIEKKINNG